MWLVTFLIAFVLAYPAASAQNTPGVSRTCLNGLAPLLVAGGFTGSVDCKLDRLTVRRVGQIKSSGHRFAIYDYRYRLAPVCPECSVHGGQRVIVLRDGIYLGQYKPDFMRIEIAHNKLILTPDDEPWMSREYMQPIAVPFKAGGPPWTIWVGGDDSEFFK